MWDEAVSYTHLDVYKRQVLVMRDTTERPEALEAGTVNLVGTDYDKIVAEMSLLLDNDDYYDKMHKAVNPYGDGKACSKMFIRDRQYIQDAY